MKKTEGGTWASWVKSTQLIQFYKERERVIKFSLRQGSICYQCHQHCLSYQFLTEIKASYPSLASPSSHLLASPGSPPTSWLRGHLYLPTLVSPLTLPRTPHCADGDLRILLTRLLPSKRESWSLGDAETSSGHIANHGTCKAGPHTDTQYYALPTAPHYLLPGPIHHSDPRNGLRDQSLHLIIFPPFKGLRVTVRKTR